MNIGIHAIEASVPTFVCNAKDMENHDQVPGKYTSGLLMKEFCSPGDNEDPVSLALSSLKKLLEKTQIPLNAVGQLMVASESFTDQNISIQSELLSIFHQSGCMISSDVMCTTLVTVVLLLF